MRRSLRELYEKLSKNREKYAAGGDSEDIASIIKEANDVLRDVKGTQEAMEDAKMFKLLCQTVPDSERFCKDINFKRIKLRWLEGAGDV